MPDRIVRDEILDSERYLGLTSDTARLLFVHFLLVADDLGNADASDHFIRRRLLAPSTHEVAVGKLLSELADADLVRIYTVKLPSGSNKRYAHIPRFRQRLRFYNGKHPRPPESIESKEIRELIQKKTVSSPSQDSLEPDSSPSQDGRRKEVKEVKEGSKSPPSPSFATDKPEVHGDTQKLAPLPPIRGEAVIQPEGQNPGNGQGNGAGKGKPKPPPQWWLDDAKTHQAATLVGLVPKVGEDWANFRGRIRCALELADKQD